MSVKAVTRSMTRRSAMRREYKKALPDLTKRIALMDHHTKWIHVELGQHMYSFATTDGMCDELSHQNNAIKRQGINMIEIATKRNDDLEDCHRAWRMKIGMILEITQTRIALNSSANNTEAVDKLLALEFKLTERRNQLMQSLELCPPENNMKIIENTRKEVLYTFERKQRQIDLLRYNAHSHRLQIDELLQQYKLHKKPSKTIAISEREFISGDIYKEIKKSKMFITGLHAKLLTFRQANDRLKIQAGNYKDELRQLRKTYKKLEESSKFWLSIILEINEIYNRLRCEE